MNDVYPGQTDRQPDRATLGRDGEHALSRGVPTWVLPLAVFAVLASLTFWVYTTEVQRQRDAIVREVRVAGVQLARRLEQGIDDLFRPVRRMRREYLLGRWFGATPFVAEAASVHSERPVFGALAWVGSDSVVRAVVPLAANESLQGMDLGRDPAWRALLSSAVRARDGAASPVLDSDPTDRAFDPARGVVRFVMPFIGPSPTPQDFRGAIAGEVDLSRMTRDLTDRATAGYFDIVLIDASSREVHVNDQPTGPIDTAAKPMRPIPNPPAGAPPGEPFKVLDDTWTLHLTPTRAFVALERGPDPIITLIFGLGVSTVVSGTLGLIQRQRRRQLQQTARYQHALESLNEFTALISSQLGQGNAVMEHLTRVATELTNMDMASVAVLRDNDTHFEIIASYGQDPPMDVKRFRVEEIPTAKICIETGRVFPVPDTRGPLPEGLNLNTRILEKFGIRAILQIPLRVEGKSIGALALGCRSPHPFSEADLRLAELLGSQTAVILHNSGLIERTRTAMKAQKRLTEQRRRVYWVMAAVYQAGTMEKSIRRVARMAPRALSVDTAVVCIPTDRPGYFRVAATGPQASSGSLVVGSVLHLSDAQRALTERRTRVVGAGQSGSVGEASSGDSVFGDVETGSAAYLPLIAHAPEPIGVLVLIRRRGRGLKRVQLRMAKLLASRAAVAIESSRLHHRAQLDAAAKATLLRELNHRVKNNLAAISGLLSIGQPPLDAPALAWLDRAVERINTMARAHELFTGGAGDVSLPQLIDQLMPTLEVLAPPGVTVLAQVDRSVNGPAAQARLEPDQAVALAMVLHELCVNAIVHGLGDTGTLTVRADFTSGIDSTAPGLAVVEVVDAGGPGELSKGSMAHRSTGVGLDLVRDMVRRELSGTFTLDRQDAATTASVRFPLRRDDLVL